MNEQLAILELRFRQFVDGFIDKYSKVFDSLDGAVQLLHFFKGSKRNVVVMIKENAHFQN